MADPATVFLSDAGSEGTTRLKYEIPTRALLGLRNAMLTATKGTAVLNTNLIGWVRGSGAKSGTTQLQEHACMRVLGVERQLEAGS